MSKQSAIVAFIKKTMLEFHFKLVSHKDSNGTDFLNFQDEDKLQVHIEIGDGLWEEG